MSALIARICSGSNQPRRCRKPASARKCAMSASSSSGPNARWRSSGAPSRSRKSTSPRACTGRASMSERSTTHQSRKLPRLPRVISSRPPVRNVIGVFRSLTMSATSSSVSRTTAAPSSSARTTMLSPSMPSVHVPEGVTKVNGATTELARTGHDVLAPRRDELRELLREELARVDGEDVIVGTGAEVERNHRLSCSTSPTDGSTAPESDSSGDGCSYGRRSMSARAASRSRRRYRLRVPAVHERGRAVVVDALGDAPREQARAGVADPALARHRVGALVLRERGFLARRGRTSRRSAGW